MGVPLEVLRISTVVDMNLEELKKRPLEVLRISTVVDGGLNGTNTNLWKC